MIWFILLLLMGVNYPALKGGACKAVRRLG